jgi:glycosyltransferase involved in cell wall biosynthesis
MTPRNARAMAGRRWPNRPAPDGGSVAPADLVVVPSPEAVAIHAGNGTAWRDANGDDRVAGLLHFPASAHRAPEVSVVMPCLNEEETIGRCVRKALDIMLRHGIDGEVVVADNGSTDRSVKIAEAMGARVVHQPLRGYGNAYMKGFAEARGRYLVMIDSDDTYEFADIPHFVALLRTGKDFVNGNRFKGKMAAGAMTWSHRYVGNPLLSGLLNVFFHTQLGDAHCGMRAFTREAYEDMHLQTPGMEFASEMVIHAAKAGLAIAELPTNYYPRDGESKLHTIRDGWRHLRFLLVYSPTHLFLLPGLLFFCLGLLGMALLLPGPFFAFGRGWDVHVMILSALVTLLGYQVLSLGIYAKTFSLTLQFDDRDPVLDRVMALFTLERGLMMGVVFLLAGIASLISVYLQWAGNNFGALAAIRPSLLGMTLMAVGGQTIFSSFLLSLFTFRKLR